MFRQISQWVLNQDPYKLPPFLIFSVTYKCNSKCRHCFFAGQLNKKGELSLKEIKKISKNLGNLAWFHLSGGEPFLRDDLAEICETFFKNNKAETIAIPTNSLLPDKILRTTEKILKKCPNVNLNILLSLDGIGKVHDDYRGIEGNFEKVMETHSKIRKLQKKHKNLSMTVCSTVSNQNYENMFELMEFVTKMDGVDFHSVELMRGMPRDSSLGLPSVKKLKKLYKVYNEKYTPFYYKKRDYRHGYRDPISKLIYSILVFKTNSLLNKLQVEVLQKKQQPIPCHAGISMGVIEPNGNVKFCEVLPNVVGSLRDVNYDFKKIWFSEKANNLRKFISEGRCYCTHCLFLMRSMEFSPRLYGKVLMDSGWKNIK